MTNMGGGEVGQPVIYDAYKTTCSDFAPSEGDNQACDCSVAVD